MQLDRVNRTLLWIVPKWPLPADDGARVATVSLLQELTKQGETIDLLSIAGHDERVDVEEGREILGVRRIFVLRRESTALSVAENTFIIIRSLIARPLTPVTMRYFATAKVRQGLAKVLKGMVLPPTVIVYPAEDSSPRTWDCTVYDLPHTAVHSSRRGKFIRPPVPRRIVHRSHNYETALWERKEAQTKTILEKAFLRYQAWRVREFEKSLVRAVDAVATVSEEDLVRLKELSPGLKGKAVPIGYHFAEITRFPEKDTGQIMFLGRLDWYPNRDGLIWFLQEVWPFVVKRREDLHLVIAGSGDSGWLSPHLGGERVKFLGRVEKVEDLYRDSLVSLVPIFYGSGTRVKAIEASRFGRACLSTAVGVEGIGLTKGKGYFHAESAYEWQQVLVDLTKESARRVGERAFREVKKRFQLSATALEFRRLIDDVMES